MSTNTEWIKETTINYYRALQAGTETDKILVCNKVVELNIKLVSRVLSKYRPYTEDQFQIGCIGLINAARTYELSREVPFASYAAFCIERAIQMDYNERMNKFEAQVDNNCLVYLDATTVLGNGDKVENNDIIYDERAETELNKYIEENELTFISEHIIKPVINELASKGQNSQSKLNVVEWERLEFVYIMDVIMIDSQKQRMTLKQIAAGSNVSIQNVKTRHAKVMDELFQRMWTYMMLNFSELFARLRGEKKVPHKLICFDPGKTTGWCTFIDGKLDKTGHIEHCYDDNNIDVAPLMNILNEEKPDFILYEDYKVYSHKLARHTFNPIFTLRLIGAIEAYSQINNIPTHKQMAVTAKNFVTDEKLKSWGFWETGMRHARDAIRHGCYFLLFYKKGENIID